MLGFKYVYAMVGICHKAFRLPRENELYDRRFL